MYPMVGNRVRNQGHHLDLGKVVGETEILNNNSGEIDAEMADVIVQAGLFGKIIYG